MAAFRAPLWRRLINTVLLGSFLAFIGELPVADVHDGDAPAAELAHADQLPGHLHSISAQQEGQDPGSPGHDLHVCHCGHTHLSSLPGASAVRLNLTHLDDLSSLPALKLPDTSRAPAVPPPIA